MLWGRVAQALEAVATYNNRTIQSHRDLKKFAIQLSRDLDDEAIINEFIVAESLHHNFYDVQQEPSDIEILIPTIQRLVTPLAGYSTCRLLRFVCKSNQFWLIRNCERLKVLR